MVENRPWLTVFTHVIVILGILVVAFPIYIGFVASTHTLQDILQSPMPLLPGGELVENYASALTAGANAVGTPAGVMLLNSLIMALGITIGKISISLLAAFAIVYFRFPLRMLFFWMIFITLMLPVEVRIMPTYEVAANIFSPLRALAEALGWQFTLEISLLDSYPGLILPLIASATATFLFRQVFLAVPDELLEAARIDGAGPLRFFKDILLPLSRTNIAAMFVILFIYGWNQYLWPLLITTDERMYTVLIGINRMLAVGDDQAQWQIIMATTMLAMLPPVLVVVVMQRLFVKGLVETEK